MLYDNEHEKFKNEDEMLKYLLNQKETDQWKKCSINELELIPLDYIPILVPVIRDQHNLTADDDVILSTMLDTGLMVKFACEGGWRTEMIRKTAWKSICDRAKLKGKALTHMSLQCKTEALNSGLNLWKSKCLILFRDEKVSAIHSGDPADYSVLPVYDLLKALLAKLANDFGDYTFISGYIDHTIVQCQIKIDSEGNNLMEPYESILKAMNRAPFDYSPTIEFSTSDVATSGANIYPYLSCNKNNTKIGLGNPLFLAHKNKATIDDFEANASDILSLYKSCAEDLGKLKKINIYYPIGCLKAVAKELKLPKKASFDAAEVFSCYAGDVVTALDVYWALWEIVSFAEAKIGKSVILDIQEKITRALRLNWHVYDYDEKW